MYPLLKTCVLKDQRIVAVFPCVSGNELVDAHVITYDDWSRRFSVHSFPEALRFARKQLGWG